MYLLDLLLAINIFKFDNTSERAVSIWTTFFINHSYLPDFKVKLVKISVFAYKSAILKNENIFEEIEEYILIQFDVLVYPNYFKSHEYQNFTNEMQEFF